jgi:methylmalonyl-CoA/ethylmalonyl-CoA epimerase
MITGFSHVSIAVPDLEAAAKRLAEIFGLAAGPAFENAEQGVRLAYAQCGATRIELIAPLRPDSPIAKFLERNPRGGIHHFALSVDDIDGASRDLAGKGVRTLGSGGTQRNVGGDKIAFLHPADCLGALVELEEQPAEYGGGRSRQVPSFPSPDIWEDTTDPSRPRGGDSR